MVENLKIIIMNYKNLEDKDFKAIGQAIESISEKVKLNFMQRKFIEYCGLNYGASEDTLLSIYKGHKRLSRVLLKGLLKDGLLIKSTVNNCYYTPEDFETLPNEFKA